MMNKKIIGIFIVGLSIGIGVIPTINAYTPDMEQYNITSMTSLLYNFDKIHALYYNYNEGNINFNDYVDDVICMNFSLLTLSRIYRSSEKSNINIVSGSCSKLDMNVTLTLEVEGEIEDRGNFSSYDFTVYNFYIISSEKEYNIDYINKTCTLLGYDNTSANITNYLVDGSFLNITFRLNNTSEIITSLEIIDIDYDLHEKNNFTTGLVYIDAATNIEYNMDIEITKPANKLYLFNKKILPLPSPVIIGKIYVECKELLNATSIAYKELYIDGELTATPNLGDHLIWDKLSFGKHTLKVLAFDMYGNRALDEIEVWKFF